MDPLRLTRVDETSDKKRDLSMMEGIKGSSLVGTAAVVVVAASVEGEGVIGEEGAETGEVVEVGDAVVEGEVETADMATGGTVIGGRVLHVWIPFTLKNMTTISFRFARYGAFNGSGGRVSTLHSYNTVKITFASFFSD